MNIEDVKLKLLANLPIPLSGNLAVHMPSFKKIAEIGMSVYYHGLSLLLIDKSLLGKEIDERVTNFDIFYANCYHDESFRTDAFSALRLLFREEPSLSGDEHKVHLQFPSGELDHSNFDDFQKMLKIANHLKLESEPEFKPGNSKAQELIDKILRNRTKEPKRKEKMDLASMVNGLAWKPNGLSLIEIFELNIYQIYAGFHTTNNIDNYHYTLSGLYAGVIDSKNINMSDIHWANKIN
ncbi:hypothetical protein [Paenibacillus tuaregi]|uniref:hypothetical protein n=1 Tax=Paenibacillus tuaregi TaxID=1816681 RepID=UPI0008391A7A|nr:hypothetical protein [Paenibacillus tuaregi]